MQELNWFTVVPGKYIVFVTLLLMAAGLQANTRDNCVQKKLKTAVSTTTVGELQTFCTDSSVESEIVTDHRGRVVNTAQARLLRERDTQWSPYILTAHKQNYFLVYSWVKEQNPVYDTAGDEQLAETDEAKFQLSVKVPLTENSLFMDGDSLHLGFTMKTFWQVYNKSRSAPIREAVYAPEIFYTAPLHYKPHGADTALRFGLEHESNGRTQLYSRSWNRLYAQVFYARDNYLISFRPWYRIPESESKSTTVSDDDNPDIEKYMGNFELNGVLTHKDMEFSAMLRNNLRSDNHGAIEFGVSFPLWGCIRGYAQYFNGYGESMIDYDHRMERFGIGLLLTDLM